MLLSAFVLRHPLMSSAVFGATKLRQLYEVLQVFISLRKFLLRSMMFMQDSQILAHKILSRDHFYLLIAMSL